MTRIASRAPELDIFGQRLIEREAGCWIITAEGRQLLQTLEQLDRDGEDAFGDCAAARDRAQEPSPPQEIEPA
jgi:DNA-binding transcriptional LysR family regulator